MLRCVAVFGGVLCCGVVGVDVVVRMCMCAYMCTRVCTRVHKRVFMLACACVCVMRC